MTYARWLVGAETETVDCDRLMMIIVIIPQSPGSFSTAEPETPKPISNASPALPAAVDAQLQRLNAALTGRLSSQRTRRTRDSVSHVTPPGKSAFHHSKSGI